MSIKLLLIEDNPDHIVLTQRILEKVDKGYQLDSVRDAKEGLDRIFQKDYDLILCDYRLSGLTALNILEEMGKKNKDTPFIVVTASGNEKTAVDLMKEGAYDYILKDLSYEETLPVVIERSIERYNTKKAKERLEKTIKEAAEEWETTFNSITDLISIHNRDLKIMRVNKAFANMFKMKPEKIIGKTCHNILHGTETIVDNCPFKQALETKKTVRVDFFEPRLGIYFEVSVSPIFNEEGEVIATVHIAKDISERKNAEQQLQTTYQKLKETQQQLIQSSKMAAMGQLVAGVSHELSQPLTGIKGFAQAVLMDLEENSPLRQDLQKIIEQADRMDNIIKNLRFFARKSEFKTEKLDINKPLRGSLMLLNQQLKVHNIRLNTSLDENLPKILGDANQLQQVFLNLLTNARDAIDSLKRPTGGEIIIKTSLSKDKNNIEITFQDTGCGIPDKHLEYIFDPFFTTKSFQGGMGLGLSIVYGIIEEHKGSIEVKSQEGKGTTLRITLPITA